MTTDPSYFVETSIPEWARDVIFKCDDVELRVAKGYGDGVRQDVHITLESTGYAAFLYDNQEQWLSGALKLRTIRARLKNRPASVSLATGMYMTSLDPAATERDGEGDFRCLSTPYLSPEMLQPFEVSHLGQARLQTYLKLLGKTIRDPELLLTAFRPGGLVFKHLAVLEPILSVIYFALRTGREPSAVMDCLSNLDITQTREGVEELVNRAHRRMVAH